MTTTSQSQPETGNRFGSILQAERRNWNRASLQAGAVAAAIIASGIVVDLFDFERLFSGMSAIGVLMAEMVPPDFTNAGDWVKPVIDTLAMSVAGTALAVALSIPLAFLAAENTAPNKTVYRVARFLLNLLRSVPELIMGIVFVAAVGSKD